MATRVTVYIDGFNLYYGLRESGWRRFYWLNPARLGELLLREGQTLELVRYFTTRISRPTDKRQRQNTWLEAIEDLPRTRVFYGHYLDKPKQCRRCGAKWMDSEEKKTDVNIAVEMMADAYQDRCDLALLVSGDSDLVPPIEAIRTRFPERRLIVVFPPRRSSRALASVASASFVLGRKVLQDSQLPDEYTKRDGFTLRRPAKWR